MLGYIDPFPFSIHVKQLRFVCSTICSRVYSIVYRIVYYAALVETGDMLKEKLLKLEEKVKEERRKRDLERTKKPTTILQLILLALKHSEAESDIIEGLEGKSCLFASNQTRLKSLSRV